MQPIIHFLYESGVLSDIEIIDLMRNSLHSEEIFKVVQSMLGWLKLKHLFLCFLTVLLKVKKNGHVFFWHLPGIAIRKGGRRIHSRRLPSKALADSEAKIGFFHLGQLPGPDINLWALWKTWVVDRFHLQI